MIFLFGANSLLGWSIFRAGPQAIAFCNGFTRSPPPGIERSIHLDDELAVSQLFAREQPELIVHCAGVCDVATCEEAPDFAYSVNVDGTRILLDYAPAAARIVYCSSDHVFGGDAGPYAEDTAPSPISVYGETRAAAEQLVLARANTLVVRGGLWIGPSSNGRMGHLDWLRQRHRRGLPMTIVADEHRSAVWAEDAARRVWDLAHSSITGIRHLTTTHPVSRPELAHYLSTHFEIGAQFEVVPRVDQRSRGTPHLGHVELATIHTDALAAPLAPVVPRPG
ncbi:MAG: sugar nucleotide-binding protein [Myxococcota bacterium]|nr:sugar nucleotide-binding protein [Myxococcota bacterium]